MLYRLVGDLALVADRLPRLVVQLERWLRAEHNAGRDLADTGSDSGLFIIAATAQLADAGDAAHDPGPGL